MKSKRGAESDSAICDGQSRRTKRLGRNHESKPEQRNRCETAGDFEKKLETGHQSAHEGNCTDLQQRRSDRARSQRQNCSQTDQDGEGIQIIIVKDARSESEAEKRREKNECCEN